MASVLKQQAGSIEENLRAQLDHIAEADRRELVSLWTEHVGQQLPVGLSTNLVRRAVAHHLQQKVLGGLKAVDVRALGRFADARRTDSKTEYHHLSREQGGALPSSRKATAQSAASAAQAAVPLVRTALRPGTRLVRDWQGTSHVVDVTATGFRWNGGTYDSLSAVALAITGARWSGPRFFRL